MSEKKKNISIKFAINWTNCLTQYAMRFDHITQRNILLAKKLLKIPKSHIKAAKKICYVKEGP